MNGEIDAIIEQLKGEKTRDKFVESGEFIVTRAVYGGKVMSSWNGGVGPCGYSKPTGFFPIAELDVRVVEGQGYSSRLSRVNRLVCLGNISGVYEGDRIKAVFYSCTTREGSSLDSTQEGNRYFGREIREMEHPSLVTKLDKTNEPNELVTFKLIEDIRL